MPSPFIPSGDQRRGKYNPAHSLKREGLSMRLRQPNILFIMSDDHAAHAIGAYGSVINKTPNLDRIAAGGVRLDTCFCTNAICTPSRATILTGQYGHITGVRAWEALDNRRPAQVQKCLQAAGYQTAMIGKWHLGHGVTNNCNARDNRGPGAVPADPAGFDHYAVLPGHGKYEDPLLITPHGDIEHKGYISDVLTDLSLEWLNDQWDADRPFFLCVHHKAPHRPWTAGEKYRHLYEDGPIPEPETFFDDYATRPAAAAAAMRVGRDLTQRDLKAPVPAGLSDAERASWCYQRYIKDYLRCVASVDASVGRLLDWLDEKGLAEDTIVVYTSDQGFFLGDHGWFDKRFFYEHSLRMPLLMRYPRALPAGATRGDILTNTDFAQTLLDYAGVEAPGEMQGVSGRAMLEGRTPHDWQQSLYYRYWLNGDSSHRTSSHYGVRTHTHKLIYYYCDGLGTQEGEPVETGVRPYWELFDLREDPNELRNVYGQAAYAQVQRQLHEELERLQRKYGDKAMH
jgi:arylsulfatase A-like enzyme